MLGYYKRTSLLLIELLELGQVFTIHSNPMFLSNTIPVLGSSVPFQYSTPAFHSSDPVCPLTHTLYRTGP